MNKTLSVKLKKTWVRPTQLTIKQPTFQKFRPDTHALLLYPIPPEMKLKKRIGNLISLITLIDNAHIFKVGNNL